MVPWKSCPDRCRRCGRFEILRAPSCRQSVGSTSADSLSLVEYTTEFATRRNDYSHRRGFGRSEATAAYPPEPQLPPDGAKGRGCTLEGLIVDYRGLNKRLPETRQSKQGIATRLSSHHHLELFGHYERCEGQSSCRDEVEEMSRARVPVGFESSPAVRLTQREKYETWDHCRLRHFIAGENAENHAAGLRLMVRLHRPRTQPPLPRLAGTSFSTHSSTE